LYTDREIEAIIGKVPNWHEYELNDVHYMHFSANILASIHKIGDVFHTFCNARAALLFAYQKKIERLMNNDTESEVTFIRSHLLLNSLVLYNICIDLSWQVLWLRFGTENLELIHNNKIYDHSLNECNFETLQYRLTLAKEFKIRDYIKNMFESNLWGDIRRKYNYHKHRGSFYIEGLGENRDKLMFSLNGQQPKCIAREEFNLEEWTGKFIVFNGQFLTYFENIIGFVIPQNYNSPIGAEEIIRFLIRLEENKKQVTNV